LARLASFLITAGRRTGAGRRSSGPFIRSCRQPLVALAGLVLLLGATGCGMNDEKAILMAAGSYGDVAIALSDESLRPATERFLVNFNPSATFVIQPETVFKVDIFGPRDWEVARGYKNAILLVRIGSGNAVAKQANA
jgi:hypothetical protein